MYVQFCSGRQIGTRSTVYVQLCTGKDVSAVFPKKGSLGMYIQFRVHMTLSFMNAAAIFTSQCKATQCNAAIQLLSQ